MHVAILGGWSAKECENAAWGLNVPDPALFAEACRAIGERLARRGHSITVGSQEEQAADRHVVDGYIAAWSVSPSQHACINVLDGIHSDQPLFTERRREQTTARLFRGGPTSRPRPHPRAAEKLVAIRDADAVVAIGGLQDTYTAGIGAIVASKPVVPIATFGGASLELWNATRLLRRAGAFDPRPDDDFERLKDSVWSAAVLDAAFGFGRLDRPSVFLASAGKAERVASELSSAIEVLGLDVIHWPRDFHTSRPILEEIRLAAFIAKYAVILLTPDDRVLDESERWRPRENVLFEMGYFMNALGADRVAVVVNSATAVPSDYGGFRHLVLSSDQPVRSLVPELRRFFAEDIATT